MPHLPAFEAEGNPPAILVDAEDLEVAFREGLQKAWKEERWADFIALADQHRKMLGNPTIDPLYLRITRLEQRLESLEQLCLGLKKLVLSKC